MTSMKTPKSYIGNISSLSLLLSAVVFLLFSPSFSSSPPALPAPPPFSARSPLLSCTQADGCPGLPDTRKPFTDKCRSGSWGDISKHISHHKSIYLIISSAWQFRARSTATKNIGHLLLSWSDRWAKMFFSNHFKKQNKNPSMKFSSLGLCSSRPCKPKASLCNIRKWRVFSYYASELVHTFIF